MRRNRHDCTGSVAHEYIVGYPDRYFLTVDRIDCGQTVDCDTGLILCKLGTLEIRLSGSLLTVCKNLIPVLDLILILVKVWVLR